MRVKTSIIISLILEILLLFARGASIFFRIYTRHFEFKCSRLKKLVEIHASEVNVELISRCLEHDAEGITYELRCEKTGFWQYAKTKTQISFAVTVKLISAFVFAT